MSLLLSVDAATVPSQPVGPVGAGLQLGTTGLFDTAGGNWTISGNAIATASNSIVTDTLLCSSGLSGALPNQGSHVTIRAYSPANGIDVVPVVRVQANGDRYEAFFFGTGAQQFLIRKQIGGVATQLLANNWSAPFTSGHDFQALFDVQNNVGGTLATLTVSVLDLTTSTFLLFGGQPLASVTDATILGAGQIGVAGFQSPGLSKLDLYGAGAASMAVNPGSIVAGSAPGGSAINTVVLTGTNTSWNGGTTTFTLTNAGGTNASIATQSVLSGTSAVLTIDAGTVAGTVTLGDGVITQTLSVAANAATSQVVFLGDSLMAGQGLTAAQNIAGQAFRLLGPLWKYTNLGASGHTVLAGGGQINWAGGIALFDGALLQNVAVFSGGDNDFNAGATPAQVYAGFKAELASYKAAGFQRVYLLTLPPYPAALSGSIAAAVPVFNNLCRANWQTDGFTALIDIAAMQPFNNQAQVNNNLTYFQGTADPHTTAVTDTVWGQLVAGIIASGGAAGGGSGGGGSGTFPAIGCGFIRGGK